MKINAQLIQDCRKGDRKAQFQLYDSCYNVLMGVCMRYKKEESEALAALNGGFLKILNNLGSYRPEVPFEAWIRRIMINTLIDEFRKNRKVKELIEYKDLEADGGITKDLVDYNLADKVFDAEELEALIKMLPPVSQKVFNLFAIDGYSHKEIGVMLGISDGTSKWHLSFARKKLKELMQKMINKSKVI
ncbi:MAG: RNA polymerase sigma factor [Saprospiraceae bacterium]